MSARALRLDLPRAQPGAFLPYGRQLIEEDDIVAVVEALRGDLLTTGPFVERFETGLAAAVGAEHAVVCANGTAALHMAARALGLGPGSKVIVPAITFLATASAPHMNGAEIVFADVDPQTGLMRAEDLKAAFARAGRADAVFNVHLNGQCGDIEAIAKVARLNGAKIVEDACHAIGTGFVAEDGSLTQIGANAFSDLTVFSFHPVKTIAMGEGGAVTTNDPEMAARLARARNHGMTRRPDDFVNVEDAFDADGTPNPWYYELVEPEFNWRANDIQCALGLSQLGKLGRFVTRRRALAAAYDAQLTPLSRAQSLQLGFVAIHRADEILDVVAIFMRDHIGLRELSRRAELLGKLVEEGQVQIDALVVRAVERPGGRLAFAARCRCVLRVEGDGGGREGHAARLQDRRPHIFGGADDLAREIQLRVVGVIVGLRDLLLAAAA